METFGKRLARLRKDASMTQDELSEKLHVSRQTISSWERDRSEPDMNMLNQIADLFLVDMNILLRGITKQQSDTKVLRYVFLLTTIFQIVFSIFLVIAHKEKSIGGVIVLFVLLIINFIMYCMINYMINNNDYSLLAGYDEGIEYNIDELERMLQRMQMSCIFSTMIWTILLLILYIVKLQTLWPLVCVIYTFDFIGKIILENYRSRKKILKNEKDILANKRSYPSMIIFIILLFAWVAVMFLIMEVNAIRNNTNEAKVIALVLIIFMIINIAYLFYGQWYARKDSYHKNKEITIAALTIIFNVICMLMLIVYMSK